MPRSLGEGFRTGAFLRAVVGAVLLLAAIAAASLFPATPSFSASHEAPAAASDGNPSKGDNRQSPGSASIEEAGIGNPISHSGLILSGFFLLFAILFMVTLLVGYRGHILEKSGEIERIGIVTVLVVGALCLMTVGFRAEDTAPAFGLLGTIAGYLLGQVRPRRRRSDRVREEKTTDEKDT